VSAQKLLQSCRDSGLKLVVAESLTGGALAAELVAVPGASEVFAGGIVAYDSKLKVSELGVAPSLIESPGPVSLEVATQMAHGARNLVANSLGCSEREVLAIATTGVAGPTEQGARVGKVFVAVALGEQLLAFEHHFEGDRNEIRTAAVVAALEHANDLFV
jgi:nicotinamide-nucleotide amidase